MNAERRVKVNRNDVVSSSIYRKFIISYALMAVVPLLVFGYFVTVYIIPEFQTVENLLLITVLTVFLAVIGFLMMRNILIAFLKLKKYTRDVAEERLISINERPQDQDVSEMVLSLNRIIGCLLHHHEEFKSQRDKLQERYDEIQRLGKSKEELVRMIAHDVKNFIILISAHVELLASGGFDGDLQRRNKYLQGLKFSVMSLKHMIDNMLYIESMESGQRSFNLELLDLQELSHECLTPLKLLFEAENLL